MDILEKKHTEQKVSLPAVVPDTSLDDIKFFAKLGAVSITDRHAAILEKEMPELTSIIEAYKHIARLNWIHKYAIKSLEGLEHCDDINLVERTYNKIREYQYEIGHELSLEEEKLIRRVRTSVHINFADSLSYKILKQCRMGNFDGIHTCLDSIKMAYYQFSPREEIKNSYLKAAVNVLNYYYDSYNHFVAISEEEFNFLNKLFEEIIDRIDPVQAETLREKRKKMYEILNDYTMLE